MHQRHSQPRKGSHFRHSASRSSTPRTVGDGTLGRTTGPMARVCDRMTIAGVWWGALAHFQKIDA